jgi:hypothetical protein
LRLDEYGEYDGIGLAELVERGEVPAGELKMLAAQATGSMMNREVIVSCTVSGGDGLAQHVGNSHMQIGL